MANNYTKEDFLKAIEKYAPILREGEKKFYTLLSEIENKIKHDLNSESDIVIAIRGGSITIFPIDPEIRQKIGHVELSDIVK